MAKKEALRDIADHLLKAQEYLRDKLCYEEDRQVRTAIFAASHYVSLALLLLTKINFLTDGKYNNVDRNR